MFELNEDERRELNENERQWLHELYAKWQELSAKYVRRGLLSPGGREAALHLLDELQRCNSFKELEALGERIEIVD